MIIPKRKVIVLKDIRPAQYAYRGRTIGPTILHIPEVVEEENTPYEN